MKNPFYYSMIVLQTQITAKVTTVFCALTKLIDSLQKKKTKKEKTKPKRKILSGKFSILLKRNQVICYFNVPRKLNGLSSISL